MSDEYSRNDFWHNPQDVIEDAPTAGSGIIDAAYSLHQAAQDNDQVAIGIGSAGMALDVLGLVMDPLGTALAAGIGWLIEHVTPFRVPLDMMMGDPAGIDEAQAAIDVQKENLVAWADKHKDDMEILDSWSGAAADAFKREMAAVGEHLNSLGSYVESASKNMGIAGAIIGAFRGVVRDFVAATLGGLIAGAIAAVAAMPFTFGTSIGIFLGTAFATIGVALAKIGTTIADLAKKLAKLLSSLKNLGKAGDDFASDVARAADSTPSARPGGGGTPPSGPSPGAHTGNAPEVNGSNTSGGNTGSGTGGNSVGTNAPPPPDRTPPPPPDRAPPPPPTSSTPHDIGDGSTGGATLPGHNNGDSTPGSSTQDTTAPPPRERPELRVDTNVPRQDSADTPASGNTEFFTPAESTPDAEFTTAPQSPASPNPVPDPPAPTPTPPPTPGSNSGGGSPISSTLDGSDGLTPGSAGNSPTTPTPDAGNSPTSPTPDGGNSPTAPTPDAGNGSPPDSPSGGGDRPDQPQSGGQQDANPGGDGPGSSTQTTHEPLPDKLQSYAKDNLNDRLDKYMEANPDFTPAARQEVLDKFDKITDFTKHEIAERFGQQTADRTEGIVRTLTDPTYGARGFATKSVIDFIRWGVPPLNSEMQDSD